MSGGGAVRWLATCSRCGKRCFTSRREAKRVAKLYREAHMNEYRCGEFWHVGHLDSRVLRGERVRLSSARKLGAEFVEWNAEMGEGEE